MRQNLVGQVIGTAMRKTVKVRVESLVTVPKLDKVLPPFFHLVASKRGDL